jgi:endogenous inhibitor of DNA gyrase (YacG/DUF329 family)
MFMKEKTYIKKCKNPECDREFKTDTRWRKFCSEKCQNHVWYSQRVLVKVSDLPDELKARYGL